MFLTVVIIVVVVLVVGVAALLGFAAIKPDAFRVQRAAGIKAPPEKILPLINDFHNWGSWSPWEKLDPALKRTYSGAASGQGAVYEWEGNKKVGQGRMEIMESSPPSKITIKLDFLKPFEAHNTAEFMLERQGDSTAVTWTMHGRQPYMIKVMSLFFSMDKMIGKDFETGLANLKSITEK
jgi:carbon monoxide dehydrogenase subunit G